MVLPRAPLTSTFGPVQYESAFIWGFGAQVGEVIPGVSGSDSQGLRCPGKMPILIRQMLGGAL